jgi:site-specific DNA-methyltransferase (adenine-specific)
LPFDSLWEQYKRVIKDNGCIALFADGMFIADLMKSNPKMWRYNLVWNKVLTSGFLNANRQPLRQHEEVVVFYKKQPCFNPQFTEGKPLHGMGKSFKNKLNANNNYGKFSSNLNPSADRVGDTRKHPTSIITVSRSASSKMTHPTEKPVGICEWLIKSYTNKGDTVLDNCMGSGNTGVACVNTGRKFIGIELDERYFCVAKKRIEGVRNNHDQYGTHTDFAQV